MAPNSDTRKTPTFPSLVELLQFRAHRDPDREAYTFLSDDAAAEVSITYAELDRTARSIAARLQDSGAAGSRALLLYPSGVEYVQAFLGCLYAGTVAVPAYPPRKNRSLDRIEGIVANAEATHMLATASILKDVERRFSAHPLLRNMQRLATDIGTTDTESAWTQPTIGGEDLAFLQYTSGSTDRPKGVMVSHDNLMHNQRLMQQAFQLTPDDRVLGWLPLYHDMGLIGNVLAALYVGAPCTLMTPVSFLQKPIRWLGAISQNRATTSGGPNFAYDLCARKTTAKQREGLDLSSWKIAFNGSEPVRASTIELFTETFAPYGFRRSAFFPCYGLAEATLFVSGGPAEEEPRVNTVDAEALADHRIEAASDQSDDARRLVSSGRSWNDQKLFIVDPETMRLRDAGEVGEIVVSGKSVAAGYWKRPDATTHTFSSHIADFENGQVLRTGDMGFLQDGELFVTGRLKDLIIIRGRNHYPQDIEATVAAAHPALRGGRGAAFSIEVSDDERLAVVHEVARTALRDLDAEGVRAAIRQAVSEKHDLNAYRIALLKTGSLPKTTSGKVQRRRAKQELLSGTLHEVGVSAESAHADAIPDDIPDDDIPDDSASHGHAEARAPKSRAETASLLSHAETGPAASRAETAPPMTRAELDALPPELRVPRLAAQLRQMLAKSRKVSADSIDPEAPLSALGLDSLDTAELRVMIETDLQFVPPSMEDLQDASINLLANQFAAQIGQNGAVAPEREAVSTDLFAKCDTDGGYFGKYRQAKDTYFTQPVLEGPIGPRMMFEGKDVIVWSINNYLGLAQDPTIHERARQALETHGTWAPMGSRLLTGNSHRHMALEARLARFLNKESSVVFNFGYMGVIGTIHSLVDEVDTVLIDSLSHACIVDGAMLASRGKQFRVFRHNDMESLEDQLIAANKSRRGGLLVVTEGVFGMTGDQAPLAEICALKDRYDARLFIDDAHGFGVMGQTGAGTAEHQGVQDQVDLYFGTFAKSFAAIGGVTAGAESVVDYVRYNARPNIFAKSLPMVYIEAVDAALDLVEAGSDRRDQVWHIARRLQAGLVDLGFDLGSTASPITPVYIPAGDEETAVRAIKLMRQKYGMFVSAVTYPVVPRGVVLFRLTATASHTDDDVDRTLEAFKGLRDTLGLEAPVSSSVVGT